MAYEEGELKTFNPGKEISREITLTTLIRHRDAMTQARTGETPGIEMNKLSDVERMFNKVRALNLIISAQRDMITISRAEILHNSKKKWERKFRTPEEQDENPFEKFYCDYNDLMSYLALLKACESDIIEAERTQTQEDDFIIKQEFPEGEKYSLTQNFREMLDELENSYEKIYLLMLKNKIVSAGIEEDDELTYKQKEQEAIERLKGA